MRVDPDRLRFEITARDGAARAGVLHTAHGPVATPAFIPLATRATVRSLDAPEVESLGYELVLGNTFHLLLAPGPDRIAALRRALPERVCPHRPAAEARRQPVRAGGQRESEPGAD